MKFQKLILLSLGHGLNDCIAGFFIGSIALLKSDLLQAGIAVTMFNLLAFGGQYPVAIGLEKLFTPKKFLSIACLLNVLAIILFMYSPLAAVLPAGIASAIYHVAGGSLCAAENKSSSIGIFAAPGVAGLIGGGLLAWNQVNIYWPLIAAAVLFWIAIEHTVLPDKLNSSPQYTNKEKHNVIDKHDLLMILLLVVISLRSVVWNIFQLIYEHNYTWLLAIALSAFAGKIAGGFLADKIGWRLYALVSVLISTPLITLFKNEIVLFCIGIGLLQSGIPATTSLLIFSLKGKTARAISHAFGTAIILGAAINFIPALWLLKQLPFILLCMFLLLLFYRNKKLPATLLKP
jgi:FSR family fosmidomycin resistance protein-like MFS transporter